MPNNLNRRQFCHQTLMGLTTAAIGSASGILLAQGAAPNRPLRCRVAGNLPRALETGTGWRGFEIDAGYYLAGEVNSPIEFIKSFNWKRSLLSMRNGYLDMMATVSFRPSRLEFMDYIGPMDTEQAYLIVREDMPTSEIDSIEQFSRFTRGIQVNFSAAWHVGFGERLENDAAFRDQFVNLSGSAYNDHIAFIDNTALRIRQRRIDGAILDYYSATEVINTKHPEARLDTGDVPLKMVRITAFGSPATYLTASRKLDASIRDELKLAYQEMRQNGSFTRYWQKWYGDRPEPPVQEMAEAYAKTHGASVAS